MTFRRKSQIMIIRNNIVHFARLSTVPIGNLGYLLPIKISENRRWINSIPKKGIRAQFKAKNDIIKLEKVLNNLEDMAILLFRTYLKNQKISIVYK